MAVGRPRAFDENEVLDRAMHVFWSKGYEGASLPELTRAMGIQAPSLYAAFGSKEGLFLRAVDRYDAEMVALVEDAFDGRSPRTAVRRLLLASADRFSDPKRPAGCFMVRGALACGDRGEGLVAEAGKRRNALTRQIQKHLAEAQRAGTLSKRADPRILGFYVATVIRGLSVEAVGDATRRQLRAAVDVAMRAWPR